MKKSTIIVLFALFMTLLIFVIAPITYLVIKRLSQEQGEMADKGPFQPITLIDNQFRGIEKPKMSWTYHWAADGNELEAQSNPVMDKEGNTYFIDRNYLLYSIDPQGKLRWKKEKFHGKNLVITGEGIVANNFKDGITCLSLDGSKKWSKHTTSFFGIYIFPNGMIYTTDINIRLNKVLTNYFLPKNKKEEVTVDEIITIDSTGKVKWRSQIDMEKKSIQKMFFDQDSNVYMVFSVVPEDRDQWFYEISSLDSDGDVRWTKKFPNYDSFTVDFIPNNLVFDDFFLLGFYTEYSDYSEKELIEINKKTSVERNKYFEKIESKRKNAPKEIVAIDKDGNELWKFIETRSGPLGETYNSPYLIDANNNIFYSIRSDKSYLKKISKTGTLLWEKSFNPNDDNTIPVVDTKGNIYIGNSGYIYSLDSNGSTKWVMEQPGTFHGFTDQLLFGVKNKLLYSGYLSRLYYCIGDWAK